jgi:hypothetical protein
VPTPTDGNREPLTVIPFVRDARDEHEELAVDGCIAKAPGGGLGAGRSPVDRGNSATSGHCWSTGRGRLGHACGHDGWAVPPRAARSDRTVEWHLRNVFTQLGICSRRKLATALPSPESQLISA